VVTKLGGGMTKNVDEAVWVVWATEVAVTVTLKLAEIDAGAMYVAEVAVTLVNVPHAVPAHPGPVALHATPLFVVSSAKLAVNCKDWPWSMLGGAEGVMVTTISVEGGLPPHPHINTRSESASASFFIICAFPLP
jgi:hypothetical protein